MAAYVTSQGGRADIMLAADEAAFIYPTLPLAYVARMLGEPKLAGWFRTFKSLTAPQVTALVGLIKSQPDVTGALTREVHRLERVNLRFTRYRYPGWQHVEEFDWHAARKWLPVDRPTPAPMVVGYVDKTRIKYWRCLLCGYQVDNLAPLKKCPGCSELGTLVGVN